MVPKDSEPAPVLAVDIVIPRLAQAPDGFVGARLGRAQDMEVPHR